MIWQQRPAGKPWLKSASRAAILAVAWLLLWRASALMEYAPHASIWFPPAALTLAAFLVLGRRAALAMLVAAVVATFWTNAIYELGQTPAEALLAGLLFAVAHGAAYWAGAALLRWLGRRQPAPSLPAMVIAFLVVASISALIAAKLGIEALILGGSLQRADSAGLWLPWWIGDMAAAVTLTPLFAGLLSAGREQGFPVIERPKMQSAPGPWLIKLLVLLVLLGLIMLTTALFGRDELLAFAVFFLIIPQMWITYTEPSFRVALSLAAFSTLIALSVGLLGLGHQAMVYQFAITVIAASTWFGLTMPTLTEQNRRLRLMTEADELTGVSSRRYFFDRAREELEIWASDSVKFALVVFDIDRFKDINDSLGHLTGDAALQQVGETIKQRLRRKDLFGRFGGDEFMVLMRDCTRERAVARAEELRKALHDIRLAGLDTGLAGTFSVVELARGESITHAFDRADATLLQAKRSGRDRVLSEAG